MAAAHCTHSGCGMALDKRGRNRSGLCRTHALTLALLPEKKVKKVAALRHYKRAKPEKTLQQVKDRKRGVEGKRGAVRVDLVGGSNIENKKRLIQSRID